MTVVDEPVIDLTEADPRTPRRGSRAQVGPVDVGVGGRRRPGLFELVAVVAISVAVVVPIVVWGRLFADRGYVVPIVAAGVLGPAVAVVTAMLGLRWPGAFAAWSVSLLVGLAAWYNTSITDLPSDLVTSWKALASSGLLISTSPEFLIPPVVVTAALGWLAVSLILRSTPNVAAILPVAAATGVALGYAVSLGELPVWYVPVIVVIVASVLVGAELRTAGRCRVRDRRRPGRPTSPEGTRAARHRAGADRRTGRRIGCVLGDVRDRRRRRLRPAGPPRQAARHLRSGHSAGQRQGRADQRSTTDGVHGDARGAVGRRVGFAPPGGHARPLRRSDLDHLGTVRTGGSEPAPARTGTGAHRTRDPPVDRTGRLLSVPLLPPGRNGPGSRRLQPGLGCPFGNRGVGRSRCGGLRRGDRSRAGASRPGARSGDRRRLARLRRRCARTPPMRSSRSSPNT